MAFAVSITNTNEHFPCATGQSLLGAMESLGRKGIPVGCRGGGCGVCKVHLDSGRVRLGTMSRACLSAADEVRGFVLACRAHPESDLTVTAVDRLARCLQRSLVERPPASFLTRAMNASLINDSTEGVPSWH